MPVSQIYNMDCMEGMKSFPDKFFELAIVDPPYGVDMAQELFKRGQICKANGYKQHLNKDWDKTTPDENYFNELIRVSVNQIIWGANYFTRFLKESGCWLIWNKVQRGFGFGDGEMAWASFDTAIRIFDYARGNESGFAPKSLLSDKPFANIHPTQKPIALYKWLLKNYTEDGYKILDTHLGSQSSRIAAYKLGFDFWGYEIDEDYFKQGCERFEKSIAEPLFMQPTYKQQNFFNQ